MIIESKILNLIGWILTILLAIIISNSISSRRKSIEKDGFWVPFIFTGFLFVLIFRFIILMYIYTQTVQYIVINKNSENNLYHIEYRILRPKEINSVGCPFVKIKKRECIVKNNTSSKLILEKVIYSKDEKNAIYDTKRFDLIIDNPPMVIYGPGCKSFKGLAKYFFNYKLPPSNIRVSGSSHKVIQYWIKEYGQE